MLRQIRKRFTKKAGLSPGTLIYTGEKRTEPVEITVIDYDASHLQEQRVQTVEECFPFKETSTVTWINIDGVHQADVIESIGKHFNVHPLVLEDVMNANQRPKIEDYENHVFIVLKMFRYDGKRGQVDSEQVSLIIGPNFVISFQEKSDGDVFDPVRERIRSGKGRIRRMGADYLAYALIDVIVDNYFIVLEKMDEEIESVEDELATMPSAETLQNINHLKKEVLFIRKSIWPLREVIGALQKWESLIFKENTLIFLRDVYDHVIEVIETADSFRDTVTGMLSIYLSSISNQTNEVMKVLTIMAAIFIPLTFIAGIYGMNFKHMPELDSRWAYPIVLGIMASVVILMLIYFRRKRWL